LWLDSSCDNGSVFGNFIYWLKEWLDILGLWAVINNSPRLGRAKRTPFVAITKTELSKMSTQAVRFRVLSPTITRAMFDESGHWSVKRQVTSENIASEKKRIAIRRITFDAGGSWTEVPFLKTSRLVAQFRQTCTRNKVCDISINQEKYNVITSNE